MDGMNLRSGRRLPRHGSDGALRPAPSWRADDAEEEDLDRGPARGREGRYRPPQQRRAREEGQEEEGRARQPPPGGAAGAGGEATEGGTPGRQPDEEGSTMRRSNSQPSASRGEGSLRTSYMKLPKIEVPERFSGEQGVKPTMKNYLMQIRAIQSRWRKDELDDEEFFSRLMNTVTGEAETFLRTSTAKILRWSRAAEPGRRDPTEKFLQMLRDHFPAQIEERVAEFYEFERGAKESLLLYYTRLVELAEDMDVTDERQLISKFLGGLNPQLRGDVEVGVCRLGAGATLEDAYNQARELEMGRRLYTGGVLQDRGSTRRRAAWSASPAEIPKAAGRPERTDDRRCHNCGQAGHLRRDCQNPAACSTCGAKDHQRRECPRAPVCAACGRRGHREEDCYSKKRGAPRGKNEKEEILQGIARLQERLAALEVAGPPRAALLARQGSEEDYSDDSEADCALMAWPARDREDIELRPRAGAGPEVAGGSGRKRGRQRRARERGEAEAARHPLERQQCQASVLVAEPGEITIGGLKVRQAIIDTGAQHVLIGQKLADMLGLLQPGQTVEKGYLLMTAEGGTAKWMPKTHKRVEIVMRAGEADECRARLICGVSQSTDYDLLLGVDFLFLVGATICMWEEKLRYRAQYWQHEGAIGELAVKFVRREPREAYWTEEEVCKERELNDDWQWWRVETEAENRQDRRTRQGPSSDLRELHVSTKALLEPITLLELFGGIGAGLTAALSLGIPVKRWILVEKDPASRLMALHHFELLHELHPDLLPRTALPAEEEMVHDVRAVDTEVLESWGHVDLVIAGWECQGYSRAGKGKGMQDSRSVLFRELLRILRTLKQAQGEILYVVENLDISQDRREPVRLAHEEITAELGAGVAWDAAQLGARAHRVRRYWQNGISEAALRHELQLTQRLGTRPVGDLLEPHRVQAPVTEKDPLHQYPCNVIGEPREAWPTLVAYKGAWGFRMEGGQPGPGMVKDTRTQQWEEPTALERELAMGYQANATAHPGVSEQQRRAALGRAMDQAALVWLLGLLKVRRARRQVQRELDFADSWPDERDRIHRRMKAEIELADLQEEEEEWRRKGYNEGNPGQRRWRPREQPGREQEREDTEDEVYDITAQMEAEVSYMALEKEGELGEGGVGPEGTSDGAAAAAAAGAAGSGKEREWKIGAQVSAATRAAFERMLQERSKCFSYSASDLGKCSTHELRLELQTEVLVYQRRRRMSPQDEEVCLEKCKELMTAGLIQRSSSAYAAATVVAARTDLAGGVLGKRMCGDYRGLNKVTTPDRYPTPMADEIFDKLEGATVFSTLDLRQGFNQIPIREADRHKTAFHGPDGLYEWRYMPFGLKNASAIFQRAMDQVLRDVPRAACYIDDVIIYSRSEEEHLADVAATLDAISRAGLTCHPGKCKFAQETVAYLGFEVKGGRLGIQQAKVEVLDRVAKPKDRSSLRALLGFLNYYRKFIPNFSKRAAPLNQLLREDQPWRWGKAEEETLQQLLEAVKTGTVLQLPCKDKPYVLYTDWSSAGIGAVLCQKVEGEEKVVAFASRSCNGAEKNYSSYEGEGLAVVWAVAHFRVYLQGKPFTVVTDHQPLLWLMQNQTLTGRNARWAMRLQEYEFQIQHRAGKTLQHVDGLSRNPPPARPSESLVALAQEIEKSGAKEERKAGAADIWEDTEAISWIRGETGAEEPASERARARGAHYRWYQQQLQMRTKEGWVLVPRKEEREEIIKKVHEQLGHFGHERTRLLVQTGWWWAGLRKQVQEVIHQCEACSRNAAKLEQDKEALNPLPILGMGFRWSLDLAGELPRSRRGRRYIIVMIEHTSKWAEVRAVPAKTAAAVAEAFEEQVLTRFGACGEVLTDQGTEFLGEFAALLRRCGIVHRRTSRYHPQADGLTERLVQTIKRCLRACGIADPSMWDVHLMWIIAGYRFGKQAALKDYSPYELLFGRLPLLPIDAPRILTDTVTAGSDENWMALAQLRAEYLRTLLPAAMENLQVAQLRDISRYKQRQQQQGKQGGAPLVPNQEVYLRQQKKHTLDQGVGAERWKVKEVRPSGVLVLENEQGRKVTEHTTNVARARGGMAAGNSGTGPVTQAQASAQTAARAPGIGGGRGGMSG